jgi:hypothetical protein
MECCALATLQGILATNRASSLESEKVYLGAFVAGILSARLALDVGVLNGDYLKNLKLEL